MKSSDLKRRICILGMLLVVVSAIFLYLGSISMPWDYQTWDGNSIYEIQYRAERLIQAQIGLILLAVGSIFQLIYLIKAEDSQLVKIFFKKAARKIIKKS